MAASTERPAVVTAAQIARLAGVGRAAVSNWRRRHDDFPEPVGGTPASPVFALANVEAWLAEHDKLEAISAGDRLWQDLRAYSEEWRLTDVLADVAAFLSFTTEHDSLWRQWASLPNAGVAERLPQAVAEHVAQEHMPGGQAFAGGLRPEQVPFWRALADLADEQGAEEVFEDLHSRYVGSSARTVAVTSLELAAVIAAMIFPPVIEGAIFDPACGTGNLLRAAAKKMGAGAAWAGQEIDPALARIAAFRLGWHDIPPMIRHGDSLRDDQFAAQGRGGQYGAALVLCDPPAGVRDWGYEELSYDPRWEFGLPPRSESELAWLQHCYAHLRPGGTAIVVMPVAAASRRSGRRIRAEMLRSGALRRVVALPPGLATNHALGVHLWILDRPNPGHLDEDGELTDVVPPARSVRMIDGSTFDRERLRKIEGDWWHQFQDEPGVTAEVAVIDLLDEDVDLTPSRYVERTGADIAAEHARARADLAPLLEALPGMLPDPPARAAPAVELPMVSIAELARAGAVHLLLDREVPHVQMELQPGDVLVPVYDAAEPPLVVTDQRGEPTPDRHVLRCDPAVLDPWFLAGFLRSDANLRRAVTGSGVFRYDIRRAHIPRLPLAEQRRYGREFQRLAEFADLLDRAATCGGDVVRLAIEGLTSGVFTPSIESRTKGD